MLEILASNRDINFDIKQEFEMLQIEMALVHKLSNAINYRPKATVPENYHDQPVRIKRHS
jgi:hypothetical protein